MNDPSHRSCCAAHAEGAAGHQHHHAPAAAALTVKDPVCGMNVDPHQTPHRHEHARADLPLLQRRAAAPSSRPTRTATLATKPPAPARPDAIYTCPMHPEVRQVGPGSCPICGMALEPLDVTAEAGPNPELADMTRRFWIGLVLTLPVAGPRDGRASHQPAHALGAADRRTGCSSSWRPPSCSGPGGRSSSAAGRRWCSRNLNMFTLIALGTGVAWIYSVVGTVAPGLFPAGLRGPDGAVAVYFEAAAVITVLVLLGQVLELRAREQTSGAIKALLDLAPKTARRLRDGRQRRGGAARPGASRAIGCGSGRATACRSTARCVEGASAVDECMVTGESLPVEKQPGRQGHRRHAQRPRQLRHAGGEGRRGDDAGAHRPDGGRGAALAGADPAAGRPGRRLVRAGRGRGRGARVPGLVAVGPGAVVRLCA